MAEDAIVSEDMAKKFATEKDTPYLRWVRGEGLDIIAAHYVPNLRTVELKPDRKSTRLNSSHGYISYSLFFFNDTATTEIYPLSLPDALPIFTCAGCVAKAWISSPRTMSRTSAPSSRN